MVTQFFHDLAEGLSGANFALLVIIDLSAFCVICLTSLLACIFSERVRSHDKRAFLYAVNALSAVTLAVFLIEFPLGQAVALTACFWLVGFAFYGVLNLFRAKKRRDRVTPQPQPQPLYAVQGVPINAVRAQTEAQPTSAVQTGVRLEHALAIADKLLLKNLSRGDRQELEKMKTSLTVLKVKGILSVQEGEALNETFNALLKLMAKYDL